MTDTRTPDTRFHEDLAALPIETRSHLHRLRAAIRATAPATVEHSGYGMPAFKLNGARSADGGPLPTRAP